MVERQKAGQQPMIILNGQAVLEDKVVRGSVTVEDGRIDAVLCDSAAIDSWRDRHPNAHIIDAGGKYVLPGLIDIHCDAIEKEVQPRPNTLFPLGMALLEFERKLPVHGITTMYHSLSLGVGLSLRGDHLLTDLVEYIHQYNENRSMIRNRIHLRYEVSHMAGLPIVESYLDNRMIDFMSFMDHSPGQGQYREPGSFERYVMKNQGVSVDEVRVIVEGLLERRKQIDWDRLQALGELAAKQGVAIASHDDDSADKVEDSVRRGVTVSEFPINIETAIHAASRGLKVCVGAPNVVRGVSHDKNLRAVDAIKAGAAHILCSDYHPSSMLVALFKLAEEGIADLPEAVRMASLHPAQALYADHELGSIKPGKAADLIVVDHYEGLPWVTDTIVGGCHIYAASVRYQATDGADAGTTR